MRRMAVPGSNDAAVAAAWPGALPLLLERVTTLEDAVAALLSGALTEDGREGARREAHRLAGALGAFGVSAGSVVARDLETAFEVLPPQSAAPGLAERVLTLRRAVEAGPQAPAAGDGGVPRVLLAGLPSARSAPILREAEGRGWHVATAPAAPEPGAADVVLLDAGLPGLEDAVARLAGGGSAVALHVEGDVDRVGLVRAGARRLIGTGLPADAVVAELAGLAADRRGATSVLVVDDDPVSLQIVAAALRAAGHEVVVCGDALDFWTALERAQPDLVALDVQMPGADGFELCRALRADPRWRATPVLFLTATTSSAAVAELFAAGGDDYVPKPVQPDELVARVAGRIERMAGAGGADVDDVTGLLRRPAAEPRLRSLIALAGRLRHELTIAAIAVDGFATLPDPERDPALAALGRVARAALRPGDVGAFWGAGEVVLGMIGSDEHAVADRLQEAVGNLGGRSGSAGLAVHPRDGETVAALVAAASSARRGAEAAGGDRLALAGAPRGGTERVDVALVEDDGVLAQLVLDGLQVRGYSTRWIADGDEAARTLGGARPLLKADLVLLDWDLPARDGLTVLRGLAADGALAATRVIMLTARASQREILSALELGASDHVAKPFSLAVLMQRVERVLAR
jgi:DNA-binding response OmpR family regulator/HPt (histidine-containing phosphotransfer) domain-containing protein